MITIRQACRQDQPAIFELIRAAYPQRWQYKIPERWRWEYENNPHRAHLAGEDTLPIFIAEEETGRIVGQLCLLVEMAQIGGEPRPVYWGVDNIVLPEYRGQGIGTRLQQAAYAAVPVFISLYMARRVRKIKEKMGMQPLTTVKVYRKALQYERAALRAETVERLGLRAPLLKRLAALGLRFSALDRLLAARRGRTAQRQEALWQRGDPALNVERLDAFDDEIDELWVRLSGQFHALIRRDAAHLRWKYLQQPNMRCTGFIARRNGRACGYILLRGGTHPEPPVGTITDMFVDRSDAAAIRSLLAHASADLRARGMGEISAASSVPEYQDGFAELGFLEAGQEVPLFHQENQAGPAEAALDGGLWLFGKGDHDWDQYPLGR